jgi:hypothetical protein
MKVLKYLLIPMLMISITDAQVITKDGKVVTTFTYDEALEMLKARDVQWEGKLEKADSLITSQKVVIKNGDNLINQLNDQVKLDSLLHIAKDSQIQLLKARDVANKKMVALVKPKWYENTYIWLVVGFILGKV